MYRSFIITIIFLQEENRRLKEQEKAVEANNLAEAKTSSCKGRVTKGARGKNAVNGGKSLFSHFV